MQDSTTWEKWMPTRKTLTETSCLFLLYGAQDSWPKPELPQSSTPKNVQVRSGSFARGPAHLEKHHHAAPTNGPNSKPPNVRDSVPLRDSRRAATRLDSLFSENPQVFLRQEAHKRWRLDMSTGCYGDSGKQAVGITHRLISVGKLPRKKVEMKST